MALLQSWRWYGPNDPVSLQDIKQAGAEGIVTALHHIPHGEVWPLEEIKERKEIIEAAGLRWVVVESVPVHEEIKTRGKDCEYYIENYRQTLRHLSTCGIRLVCYNFMPVLDWTRTRLDYELTNGAKALLFDWVDLAVFDLFLLKREDAGKDYAEMIVQQARERFGRLAKEEKRNLEENILMGVPTEKGVSIEQLTKSIETYREIGNAGLRSNLLYFLGSVKEVCEQLNMRMAIHPDDPPYPILGLPRVVSSEADLLAIIDSVDHAFNGICFCTGSLGAGRHVDVMETLRSVGHRVYFAHLRNVLKDESGSFYESDHLAGDVDMYGVMQELIRISRSGDFPVPFRPDHGHQMLDDLDKVTNPGYSAIGRLKGLAELRGLKLAIERAKEL